MKKYLFLSITFFCLNNSSAQPGEWTWVKGNNIPNQPGVYGVQGIPASTNNPPSLYEPCEWTDTSGNFWMFGGIPSGGGMYGDLWKYDPALMEWTWMKGSGILNDLGSYGTQGISAPGNYPPARSLAITSWTDLQNNLWMFGGSDYSDLWKYDISTNEWTWMKGPALQSQPGIYGLQGIPGIANNPGGREECAAAWTDNAGDLWLFGGALPGGLDINDMWRYHIATNEWTWMKGSSTAGQLGIYGTQFIEDPLNTPGARWSYARWKDDAGNLWLFGGLSYQNLYSFDDMWKFNIISNNWSWMGGGFGGSTPGSYGAKCTASTSNLPPARNENRSCWKDLSGNFWMFGGFYTNYTNVRNDLWMYCVSSNQWIWQSGDSIVTPQGSWGTKGVSDPSNKPNGRWGSISWISKTGDLYLFGGNSNPPPSTFNDVWKYVIDTNCLSCLILPSAFFTSTINLCPGTCIDFLNLSSNAASYHWYFPGASPDTSSAFNPTGICYANTGSYDVQLIASNTNGSDTLLLSNYITVFPSPPPQGILQNGDTLFANAGAASYQWYFNSSIINGATNYFYVAPQSGNYNVVATDSNGCEVEAVINNVLAYAQFAVGNWQLAIFPNPVTETIDIRGLELNSSYEISIFNVVGEKVFSAVDCKLPIGNCQLSSGLYYLELKAEGKIFRSKFVKQ